MIALGQTPLILDAPPVLRRAFQELVDAYSFAEQAWARLDPDCRVLWEEGAGLLRSTLSQEGFIVTDERVLEAPPGMTEFKFFVSNDRVARGELAVLAEGTSGIDIDMGILNPEGDMVAVDEELDSFPFATVDLLRQGTWTIVIWNNAEVQSSSVLLQRWGRR